MNTVASPFSPSAPSSPLPPHPAPEPTEAEFQQLDYLFGLDGSEEEEVEVDNWFVAHELLGNHEDHGGKSLPRGPHLVSSASTKAAS